MCLTLPEGEVHQCNEGQCYCVDCWDRLGDPRLCPECRQPVPVANRNRAAERAIAALEWNCEYCGEATTRGAMTAHLLACPLRPTACAGGAAAAAGCGWAGMMSEQAAHEPRGGLPFRDLPRLRMVAPLQAENQQMQTECQALRVENQQLRLEYQELRGQVAALQPLWRAA